MRRISLPSFFLFLLIPAFAHFVTETSFSQKGKIETVAEKYDQPLSLYRQNRIEESLRLISKGLRVDPKSVALRNLAGWCHYRLSNLEKAEEEFLTSRDLDSTKAETLAGLSYVKINRGEAQEALDCYREALKISPKSRDALVGYGICLYSFGRLRKQRRSSSTFYKVGDRKQGIGRWKPEGFRYQ